jgi:hypothetical protein
MNQKKEIEERHCSGYRTSGYWKGYPCGAIPKYFKFGKWWCKNHLPLGEVMEEKEHEKDKV